MKLTAALATRFDSPFYALDLPVHALDLPWMILKDSVLNALFDQLPNRCIVLFDDVDCSGLGARKGAKGQTDTDTMQSSVTLSGLLNALDGVWAVEGRVVVSATNHPEQLDDALKRPGRVDRMELFSYATADVAARMFRHFFSSTARDLLGDAPWDVALYTEALADAFGEAITKEVTPAQLQRHLLEHRTGPVGAVEAAGEIVGAASRKPVEGLQPPPNAGSIQEAGGGGTGTLSQVRPAA